MDLMLGARGLLVVRSIRLNRATEGVVKRSMKRGHLASRGPTLDDFPPVAFRMSSSSQALARSR